jgi:hypothetical protein
VYVLDGGVQVDVKNVGMIFTFFDNVALTWFQEAGEKIFAGFDDEQDNSGILETKAFRDQNAPHNIRYDHSISGHGTKVASKIVGQWGTAKGATLVPVQIVTDQNDVAKGLIEVFKDVARRSRKSPDFKAVSRISNIPRYPTQYPFTFTA